MARRDWYDDPEAPAPTAIVPAVTAFVRDGAGRVLLVRRSDNGLWALSGGAQDLGESLPEAVVREVREETGIVVEVTGIVGTYSDPRHVIAYDDGEVRQEFSICFRARPIGGSLRTSAESSEVAWTTPHEIASLPVHTTTRLRIDHGFHRGADRPYLG